MAATVEGTFKIVDQASKTIENIGKKAEAAMGKVTALGKALDKTAEPNRRATAAMKETSKTTESLGRTSEKTSLKVKAAWEAMEKSISEKAKLAGISAEELKRVMDNLAGTYRIDIETRGGTEALAVGKAVERQYDQIARKAVKARALGIMGSGPGGKKGIFGDAEEAERGLSKVSGAVFKVTSAISGAIPMLGGLADSFAKIGGSGASAGSSGASAAGQAASSIGSLAVQLAIIVDVIALVSAGVQALIAPLGALAASFASAALGAGALGLGGAAGLAVGLGSIIAVAKPAIAAIGAYKKAQDALNVALQSGNKAGIKSAELKLDNLEKKAPGVRDVANALKGMGDEWRKLSRPAQKSFFGLLADGIRTVKSLMPTFARTTNANLESVRKAMGTIFRGMRTEGFKNFIREMGQLFRQITGPATRGIRALASGLGKIAEAAKPFVVKFVRGLASGLENWNKNLSKTDADKKVRGWMKSLDRWWKLIKSIGSLMGAIFGPAKKPGDDLVKSLTDTFNRWAKLLRSNPKGVQNWFKQWIGVASDLSTAFLEIAAAIAKAGDEIRPLIKVTAAAAAPFAKLIGLGAKVTEAPANLIASLTGGNGIPGIGGSGDKGAVGALGMNTRGSIPGATGGSGGGPGGGKPVGESFITGLNKRQAPSLDQALKAMPPQQRKVTEASINKALAQSMRAIARDGKTAVTVIQQMRRGSQGFDKIVKTIQDLFRALARTIIGTTNTMRSAVLQRFISMFKIIATQTNGMRTQVVAKFLSMRKVITTQNTAMLANTQSTWKSMMKAVGDGLKYITTETNKVLKGFGVSGVNFTVTSPNSSGNASGRQANEKGSGNKAAGAGKARGGRLPGRPQGDHIPIAGALADGGEMVVNRHSERRINRMLNRFGTSLDREVTAESMPHYLAGLATGGRISGKVSTFGPPGEGAGPTAYIGTSADPGIAVNPTGTSSGWNTPDAQAWGRKWARVSVGGKSANLQVIDKGPSAGGRKIDVTGAGSQQMGIPQAAFPTDSIGTAIMVGGPGASAASGDNPTTISAPKIRPNTGKMGGLANAIMARTTEAANKYITSKLPAGGGAAGAVPAGKGLTNVDGKPVSNWIANIILKARKAGVSFNVSSGYRSNAEQAVLYANRGSNPNPVAPPGGSRHNSIEFPGGAVDVSPGAGGLNSWLLGSPYKSTLVYAGARDPVHFSSGSNNGAAGGYAMGGRLPWYSSGGDITAKRPTMIGVGERGAETVSIRPASKGKASGHTVRIGSIKVENHREGDIQAQIIKEVGRAFDQLGDIYDLSSDDTAVMSG